MVSDFVRSHRRKPTRLPRPRDSPGKNTGVGCHFPLQCMKEKSESKVAQSCLTLSDPMDCSLPGSSVHGIFQARLLEWGAIAFSKTTLENLLIIFKNIILDFMVLSKVFTSYFSSKDLNDHFLWSHQHFMDITQSISTVKVKKGLELGHPFLSELKNWFLCNPTSKNTVIA